jgi:hypothetical protein
MQKVWRNQLTMHDLLTFGSVSPIVLYWVLGAPARLGLQRRHDSAGIRLSIVGHDAGQACADQPQPAGRQGGR